MSSEWLRVMLDEIARKKAEGEQAKLEFERRLDENAASAAAAPATGRATAPASVPGTAPAAPTDPSLPDG